MSKKILALVLAALMLVGCLAACTDDPADTSSNASGTTGETSETKKPVIGGQVILGNTTELSGDFRFPGWGGSSAGASDQDINGLTVGYSTMETNQGGAYVWNETAVKSHTEEEKDGNLVVTIEINEGLKFSNGTEIKAVNYLAYVLAFSTQVVGASEHPGMAGQAFVGFDSYKAYIGDVDYAAVKAAALAEAKAAAEEADKEFDEEAWNAAYVEPTKVFSGVRLLGDYKFSFTVNGAAGYYPYYFANTYGAVTPYDLTMILGEGAEIKDDGEGAYISGNWYDKGDDGIFSKKAHIDEMRYDTTKYPFSGAYVITKWDETNKEATLELNPEFAGNFEGQKPYVKTLVYRKIVSETQLDQFKNGEIDVLAGITGGDDTKALLALIASDETKYAETHYQRAGYGKLQFECDFGPTQFASVRQAIAYVLNTADFAQTFTGGYGSVVYGPYSPDFDMWKAVQDDIDLIEYAYSKENALKVLVNDGWTFNEKGEAFVDGTDTVRYKKLTAEQVAALDGANVNYKSVATTDGKEYKTVKVGEDYYMPLVINWFGTTPNDVTDLLATKLVGTDDVKSLGMIVTSTTGDFNALLGEIYREPTYGYSGTPTYGMFNLATGWNSAVYDYAFNWSLDPMYFDYSSNKLYDEYDVAFPYDMAAEKLTYAEAVEASGDKLGMNYLSMAMVYNAKTVEEYNEWWMAYIERWNELVPDVPLYSNYYFDGYNAKIKGFETSPFWSPVDAILYSWIEEE